MKNRMQRLKPRLDDDSVLSRNRESSPRERMRVHPRRKPMSSYPDVVPPAIEEEPRSAILRAENPRRRAIVSINGRDVDEDELRKRSA